MMTFLYLELRKSIYRVWETVKLLQCKSFCLWEGKVDQEGLRNQRIKSRIITQLILTTYTILAYICINLLVFTDAKYLSKSIESKISGCVLHYILITFSHICCWIFQKVMRERENNKPLLLLYFFLTFPGTRDSEHTNLYVFAVS